MLIAGWHVLSDSGKIAELGWIKTSNNNIGNPDSDSANRDPLTAKGVSECDGVRDAAAALPRPAAETLPLDDAVGRIAAEPLSARIDQPPFDRSPLDGYALHSADTAGASRETPDTQPEELKLYAGDAPAAALPAGCADRILSGAPLPVGADCVLMQELTDSGEETVQL